MLVKLRVGPYLVPVQQQEDDTYIYLSFRYNKKLIEEIKAMEGAHWCGYDDPPQKIWRLDRSVRNLFQLAYLKGENPYAHYDKELIEYSYTRPLYDHQKLFSNFMLTRHYCIIGGEMGTGKTLSAIEAMERSNLLDWWYVAPKSALKAVQRELTIWKSKIIPRFLTYEALVKEIKNWPLSSVPHGVIFDESSRLKNPTAQRSQAAYILAQEIKKQYDDTGYIILMSGAPAPRNPVDWWHQCEVVCPGFLREGTQAKFRLRLSIVIQQESIAGGVYPQHLTWLDNESKCAICGDPENEHFANDHSYQKSRNEVAFLYERMQGLVLVKLKKDCLDLPDKHYRIIYLDSTQEVENIAKTIVSTSPRVITAITLLRELSDGFQYVDVVSGEKECSVCNGNKTIQNPVDNAQISCDGCNGKGTVKTYERMTKSIPCPKEDALRDLLDEHSDIGRIVIYAGFTGSVDKCVQVCNDYGWSTIRVDGRGWKLSSDLDENDPLVLFQEQLDKYPKVAFIGQPGAGGLGLTLTASPTIVYYSNDFNAENRIQSEDRIHRIGMDLNRGATIIDLVHLKTDELILENLKQKRQLQALTMGELSLKLQ